jgi:peroxiredoxin (alkyl hydroperoxide reductase subunit C)
LTYNPQDDKIKNLTINFKNMEEYKIPQTLIGTKLPDTQISIYKDNKIIDNVNLSSYSGKWLILFFYPADFTFVCPTELTELADKYEEFTKLNAEIVSISTDTAFAHKAWHDASPSIAKINYPMGADPTGKLCKAMGTYLTNEGLSLRATYIVDPEGFVKACEIQDNSIGRNANELLRKLQASIYVREHKGEVCPASWTPGKQTLTPGVDLVGKL